MRKIPQTFRKYGYVFKLIKREDCIAIYSQSNKMGIRGYEVHKVRRMKSGTTKYTNPDGTIRVVKRPDREELASTNQFGKYAWSYDTLPEAETKFQELIVKQERRIVA